MVYSFTFEIVVIGILGLKIHHHHPWLRNSPCHYSPGGRDFATDGPVRQMAPNASDDFSQALYLVANFVFCQLHSVHKALTQSAFSMNPGFQSDTMRLIEAFFILGAPL